MMLHRRARQHSKWCRNVLAVWILLGFTIQVILYMFKHTTEVDESHVADTKQLQPSNPIDEKLVVGENTDVAPRPIEQPHPEEKADDYCASLPDLYYVKVHKTGSTTFQNILYRLGFNHKLYFALFNCAFGMTYPHPPYPNSLFSNPTASDFHGYNVITDHTQFDPDVYKSYMSKKAHVISLLRHPLKQLKSAFNFWNLGSKLKIPTSVNNSDVLLTFLSNAAAYDKGRNSFGCLPTTQISLTRNIQSHHLGLKDQTLSQQDQINDFITKLDSQLDLVLILERFEESLLLFKRKYCLHIKDILHLALYRAEYFGRQQTHVEEREEEALALHRKWSAADYALYEHFTQKLQRHIDEQGQHFQDELTLFRNVKQSVVNYCRDSCRVFASLRREDDLTRVRRLLAETYYFTKTAYSQAFNISRADCALMMFDTLAYDDAIKERQWPQMCQQSPTHNQPRAPSINRQYCNHSDHVVQNFPWSVMRKSPFSIEKTCLEIF